MRFGVYRWQGPSVHYGLLHMPFQFKEGRMCRRRINSLKSWADSNFRECFIILFEAYSC